VNIGESGCGRREKQYVKEIHFLHNIMKKKNRNALVISDYHRPRPPELQQTEENSEALELK